MIQDIPTNSQTVTRGNGYALQTNTIVCYEPSSPIELEEEVDFRTDPKNNVHKSDKATKDDRVPVYRITNVIFDGEEIRPDLIGKLYYLGWGEDRTFTAQ